MQFVSVPDLHDRWTYTRQGVHKLTRSADFPPPLFTVSRGHVPVWELSQIVAWEAYHPEVRSPGLKVRKQKGYFLARSKGERAGLPRPEDAA